MEEAGYRSIQVTDTGFRLLRDWDIRLNHEIGFAEAEVIEGVFA